MASGEIIRHSAFIAPGRQVTGGTADATPVSFRLVSDQADPGWLTLLRQWDLVLEVDQFPNPTSITASAHIIQIVDENEVQLDKDIFTTGGEAFKIVRPARWPLHFPNGMDLSIYGIHARSPYTSSGKQPIEVFQVNNQWEQMDVLYTVDDDGRLELRGQNLQVRAHEFLAILNYTEESVMCGIEGLHVTVPGSILDVGT